MQHHGSSRNVTSSETTETLAEQIGSADGNISVIRALRAHYHCRGSLPRSLTAGVDVSPPTHLLLRDSTSSALAIRLGSGTRSKSNRLLGATRVGVSVPSLHKLKTRNQSGAPIPRFVIYSNEPGLWGGRVPGGLCERRADTGAAPAGFATGPSSRARRQK